MLNVIKSCLIVLMPLIAGASCVASAPSVRATASRVAPGSAVLVGRFGLYSKQYMRPHFLELQALSMVDGKKWAIPLSTDDLNRQGTSAGFFVELPPGWYRLTKWLFATSSQQFTGASTGAVFKLEPGQVTCIGSIYVGSKGVVPSSFGAAVHFKGGTAVRDECEELTAGLKAKAPLLPAPITKLALDLDR